MDESRIAPRLAPVVDEASRPFFEAGALGRLSYQICLQCKTPQLGAILCEQCLAPAPSWRDASGRGRIHAFVVMHLAYHPAYRSENGYIAAIVELEEGPRLPVYMGRLPSQGAPPHVGQEVAITFEPGEGGVAVPVARPVHHPDGPLALDGRPGAAN